MYSAASLKPEILEHELKGRRVPEKLGTRETHFEVSWGQKSEQHVEHPVHLRDTSSFAT